MRQSRWSRSHCGSPPDERHRAWCSDFGSRGAGRGAQALALGRLQQLRYVQLPQSLNLMVPATINLATRVIKTTSLLLLISVVDVVNVGQQIMEANRRPLPGRGLLGVQLHLRPLLSGLLSLGGRHRIAWNSGQRANTWLSLCFP